LLRYWFSGIPWGHIFVFRSDWDYRQTPHVPPPLQWAHLEQFVQTLHREEPVQRPAKTAAGKANDKTTGRSPLQNALCVIFISPNTHSEREYLGKCDERA
jgi:hypothetical protein